jgi:DNA mismatch repair ATPase MutS
VAEILRRLSGRARDLEVLSHVLARFERERFESGRLAELQARLAAEGGAPSRQIARLGRLIALLDQARNPMVGILAAPVLWTSHCAYAIERWRQKSGAHVAEWIEAVGELEALSSLASYAAEHPADPFPELAPAGPVFDGAGVAHPLLPESSVVRNDVRLDSGQRLLVVSGSNMSGKSTLLRAVGLNTVLAWAGAPVRCERLRVSRLQVGSSLRVQDSVLDGKSRFYAEITRLRQLMDLAAQDPPLLFLLDELLSGTNSHDRQIGSEAVLRTMVERGVIGFVTTHDLALAQVADALAPHAANVHFEDHIENGRIAFDYRMRTGVVEKSNAIELMRAVGLPV